MPAPPRPTPPRRRSTRGARRSCGQRGFEIARCFGAGNRGQMGQEDRGRMHRSEEHTSELQSLMRISYAVFCLKKKKTKKRENYIMKEQKNTTIEQIEQNICTIEYSN